ncbi:hypothetical protein GCM10028815_05690 [Mariniluteicoccus flavus]
MAAVEDHDGAGLVEPLVVRRVVDDERAVRRRGPPHRGGVRFARRPAEDDRALAREERRQQADAELAEELGAAEVELVALRAGPDGGQQFAHLVGRQPDAVVGDAQAVAAGGRGLDDDAPGRGPGVDLRARGDGVEPVLQ